MEAKAIVILLVSHLVANNFIFDHKINCILGGRLDSNGSLGNRLHSLCVCCFDGVHRYPSQDEAEKTLQL